MIANSHIEKSNTWSRIKKILKKKRNKREREVFIERKNRVSINR